MQGLREHEILAPYTSWRIGGAAERYFRVASIKDLSSLLKQLPVDEPLTWLGLGSNVLIHDEGLKGTVIHLLSSGIENKIQEPLIQVVDKEMLSMQDLMKSQWDEEFERNGKLLRIEASVPCAKAAKFCTKEGLSSSEFFAGIPGTVGGALAMNAGAWGGETWDQVRWVETIDRQGHCRVRPRNDYEIGYRSVLLPNVEEWFVAGYFYFDHGDPQAISDRIKALLKKRQLTQPIGQWSCGSVFRNPPQDFAGRLIEATGLKGMRIGNAQISEKHGNFILNLGGALAMDVKILIETIKQAVLENHGIQLQTEVRFLGFE